MKLRLPIDVIAVLLHLQKSGFEAYIVGGAVRDVIMSKEIPSDWDFTTNATPSQIQELFAESFYENEFGTVGISRQHIREQFKLPELRSTDIERQTAYNQVINEEEATKLHESLQKAKVNIPDKSSSSDFTQNVSQASKDLFEITTFRSDGQYTDFRRPETVTWGQTLEQDLYRRDFTFNAMAIHIEHPEKYVDHKLELIEIIESDVMLIDPHQGLLDLGKKIIRTVGTPEQRFLEDALRMLRAIRFSMQLDFTLDQETFQAIKKHADKLQHISWERIRDEFMKIIGSDHAAAGIELLDETGLLNFILPELLEAKGIAQGGHHRTDVWTHSIDALRHCPSKDPVVRLATLLHDIAKPQTFRKTERTITFYNHEIIGARVAKKIAERLKLPRKDIQRIFLLVRHHMFHYQPELTDAAIRRFMRRVGLENINDILDLRIGDRLGSGSKETSWRLEEMKERMQSQLHQPFEIKDLAVDGNMIMREFEIKPGKVIGETLHHLFEIVLESPEKNTEEDLLKEAEQFLQKKS